MNAPNTPQQINVELGEKEAEGIYANFAVISHSAAEMVLDFIRMLPGTPKARVFSRIIMTPQHAKTLSQALQDNIKKFEEQYGEIKVTGSNDPHKSYGFQPPVQKSESNGKS